MAILKSEIRKMAQEWKDGGFLTSLPSNLLNFLRLPRAWYKNGGTALKVGQRVYLSYTNNGSKSFNDLVAEYASDGFVLGGSTTASAGAASGFLLEPIKANAVGAVYVPGLTAAILTSCTTAHKYARNDNGNLVSTSDESLAEYYKVANSTAASGNYFCYLVPYGRSGGGHLVGETSATITGPNATCNVTVTNGASTETFSGVKCPLLRSGESIEADALVVISVNRVSGNWEIIEAQCPAENE